MDKINDFTILEHPSDTGISACSKTLEGLFEACARGMFSIICKIDEVEKTISRKISIFERSQTSLEELLLAWLGKLLYLHEVEEILFSSFNVRKIKIEKGNSRLDAIIAGENADLNKHKLFVSIKAPTYHMLEGHYDNLKSLWLARVIFDI